MMGIRADFEYNTQNLPMADLQTTYNKYRNASGAGPTTVNIDTFPGRRVYISKIIFTEVTTGAQVYLNDTQSRFFFIPANLNETYEFDFYDTPLIFEEKIDLIRAGIGGAVAWSFIVTFIGLIDV